MRINRCYALVASDEPLQIRYVGCTVLPLKVRLQNHLGNRDSKAKCAWKESVLKRGAQVQIQELSQHTSLIDARLAEIAWIRFWACYCDLTNKSQWFSLSEVQKTEKRIAATDARLALYNARATRYWALQHAKGSVRISRKPQQ